MLIATWDSLKCFSTEQNRMTVIVYVTYCEAIVRLIFSGLSLISIISDIHPLSIVL